MKAKLSIVFLFLIIFSLVTPILTAQALATKTEIKPTPSTQEAKKGPAQKEEAQILKNANNNPEDVTWRDILEYTRKANDKTLAITTHMVQTVGIVAGLLALGIGIAGFFSVRKFDSLRKELNRKLIEANKCLNIIQANQSTAEKTIHQINEFLDKIKLTVQEAQEKAEDLSKINISSELSNIVEARLNDFTRKTDFAELIGIKLEPRDYYTRGNSFYQKALYEEALREYSKTIELNPSFTEAWINKGVALGKLERYEESLAASNKAIELRPDIANSWLNKGIALEKLDRYEESLPAFNQAIKLKPDFHEAWCSKGDALEKLGRYEESLAAYNKAIELKLDYVRAWDNKGVALAKLGRREEALAAHNKAIELKPDFANSWFNKACCLSFLKNKPESLKSLAEAIRLDHNYKKQAKEDKDFELLWVDPDFKKLVE